VGTHERLVELEHEAPDGAQCLPAFVSDEREADLLAAIQRTEEGRWVHPKMRGVQARRRVACYGWDYLYVPSTLPRGLAPAPPIPQYLVGLRGDVARAAGVEPHMLSQLIVTHYLPGAGIGPHTDHKLLFGEVVASVSLGSACRMIFRRKETAARFTLEFGASLAAPPHPRCALGLDARDRWCFGYS